MDGRHREHKYQEYIQRIKNAKDDVTARLSAKGEDSTIENILEDLRTRGDRSEIMTIQVILVVLTVLVNLTSMIVHGLGLWQLISLALIIFIVLYRKKVRDGVQLVSDRFQSMQDITGTGPSKTDKINYALSGLQLKKTRWSWTRNMYTFFFPLIMLNALLFLNTDFSIGQWILLTIIAYVAGGYFWNRFFTEEVEDLEFTEEELSEIEQ